MDEIVMPGPPGAATWVYGKGDVGDMRVSYEIEATRRSHGELVTDMVSLAGEPLSRDAGERGVPRSFKATVSDLPGRSPRRRVTLVVDVDEGIGPRVVQFAVETEKGSKMTASDLRRLNLPRYLKAAVEAVTKEADPDTNTWQEPVGGLTAVGEGRIGRPGRRPISDATLQRVADLYREAKAAGVPTAAYVSERLEEKPSIAATRGWIMRARQRGFLPPVGTTDGED